MGRLDDIVARNKKAVRGSNFGIIGQAIDATVDPTDTPADRQRKVLAWAIVGGLVAVVVILVYVFA